MKSLIFVSLLLVGCAAKITEPATESESQKKEKSVALTALSSLEKIEAATQVGSTLQKYSELVIDAKAAANEADRFLPDGKIKDSLRETMTSYADAGRVWSYNIRYSDIGLGVDSEHADIIKRYSLPLKAVRWSSEKRADSNAALQLIWIDAKKRLDAAREIIRK